MHRQKRGELGHSRFAKPLILLTLIVVFLAPADLVAQTSQTLRVFEGKARIVDGDTLEICIQRFDLHGIDAPEPNQLCERDGRQWRCGMEATYAMAALLEARWVTCRQRALDAAGSSLGECRFGGPKGFSVNQEFVRQGWALAVPAHTDEYGAAEQTAKAARRGLWSGTFVTPWDWRRARQEGTNVN